MGVSRLFSTALLTLAVACTPGQEEKKTEGGAPPVATEPVGSGIVFSSTRDGNAEIYVMTAEGKDRKRLTNHPADDSHPCWSPDRKWIAFTRAVEGVDALHVMRADGSEVRRLTRSTEREFRSAWSPDGRTLAFERMASGMSRLWSMRVDGTEERALTARSFVGHPAWSPDGSKIAFTEWYDGPKSIWVMRADGTEARRIARNPYPDGELWNPAWTPDGTRILAMGFDEGDAGRNVRLYTMKPDGSDLKATAHLWSHRLLGWDALRISGDGKRILFASLDSKTLATQIWMGLLDQPFPTTYQILSQDNKDWAPHW